MEARKARSLLRFGQELSPEHALGCIQALSVPTDFDLAAIPRDTGIDVSNHFADYGDDFHDLIATHLAWFEQLSTTLRLRVHLEAVSDVVCELCEARPAVEQEEIFATLRDICNYLVHMTLADLRSALIWDGKDLPSPEDAA